MVSVESLKEITLDFKGLRFTMPLEAECFWAYYGICFLGEYDWLLRGVSGADVVLDAGANVGIFALLAAKKARMVIAVEPLRENYDYLVKNIEVNNAENVATVNAALSDNIGKGFMSGRGPFAYLNQTGESVRTTTIDALLKENSVTAANVIKMDIEGSESKALRGEYLRAVRRLTVEIHGKMNYEYVSATLALEGFATKDWGLASFGTLRKLIRNPLSFLRSEYKTGFASTRLASRYVLGLGQHPVAPANKLSGIWLVNAYREG